MHIVYYGCEAEALIGQPYTDELKQAEAARYVRDCLMTNPYITDVTDITIVFEENNLQITCKISTIYGEVSLRA